MKTITYTKIIYTLVLTAGLFTGCRQQETKTELIISTAADFTNAVLDAIGPKITRESIENISYRADCLSPKGAYTTEIHSDTSGYTMFRQTYTFKKDSFMAVIHKGTEGFMPSDRSATFSREMIFTFRSHEFFSLLLEINKRFKEIKDPVLELADSVKVLRVEAKDELGHACKIDLDSTSRLPSTIQFQDPANEKEQITTKFSRWKMINGLNLPHRILFIQGGNTYSFDIIELKINDPAFKQIK